MHYKPTVTFTDSLENLIKSKEIVKDNVPFLESNGYEYYYPFAKDGGIVDVESQIRKDSEKFKIHEAVQKIQNKWGSISDEKNDIGFTSTMSFTCVVTMYGPRGFFYTPDTIYINIVFDSEHEWVQTMLHEMLHLVFFDETKELSHAEREGYIDKKFIELWGSAFPQYKKQKVS